MVLWQCLFWHYPVDLARVALHLSWKHETAKHQTVKHDHQKNLELGGFVAPNKPKSVMETFYVFPNQKQNWKLSFVLCLRVVISRGIITWLFSSSYTLLSILFSFTWALKPFNYYHLIIITFNVSITTATGDWQCLGRCVYLCVWVALIIIK